jgi:hypothetical protein
MRRGTAASPHPRLAARRLAQLVQALRQGACRRLPARMAVFTGAQHALDKRRLATRGRSVALRHQRGIGYKKRALWIRLVAHRGSQQAAGSGEQRGVRAEGAVQVERQAARWRTACCRLVKTVTSAPRKR